MRMMNNVADQSGDDSGDVRPSPPPSVSSALTTDLPEVRQKRRTDYNRLVRTAKLKSILLEKNEFGARAESVGINKALLKRELNAHSTVLSSGTLDSACIANIQWSVKYTYQKRVIVKCITSYIVSYDGMKDFSDEVVGIFVDTNAKAITYSYFRALYAHLDWSANLGSPPLPIVQMQAKV